MLKKRINYETKENVTVMIHYLKAALLNRQRLSWVSRNEIKKYTNLNKSNIDTSAKHLERNHMLRTEKMNGQRYYRFVPTYSVMLKSSQKLEYNLDEFYMMSDEKVEHMSDRILSRAWHGKAVESNWAAATEAPSAPPVKTVDETHHEDAAKTALRAGMTTGNWSLVTELFSKNYIK